MSSSCECELCHRVFKDNRGLSIHRSRCRSNYNTTCTHCGHIASTVYRLHDHFENCTSYKIHTIKEEYGFKIQQEYNSKLEEIIAKHDTILLEYKESLLKSDMTISKLKSDIESRDALNASHLKMREDDYKHIYQRFKEEEEKRYERDQTIKELTQKLASLERKNDMLNANMIDFAKKATDKVTTIYNGNVSNVQSNTLQLQHFDPSHFRDKIKPPFRMIYSVPQLVDHLHKFGFGNVYRSCDRSRNAVVWIDNEGIEVRDSNCSQLRENALKAMEGDLRRQLVYQRERETHLEQIEGTDHLNELVKVRSNISFCHQLINRDSKLMKDVQKELSKRAKNKKDTTIDVPKIVGYTNFLSILDTTLFPNILEWITLSIIDLGIWLGNQLHDEVQVEGGSFNKESPFILIKNDEGSVKIIDAIEFHNYIKTAYNQTMSYQCQAIVDHLLTNNPSLNISNIENIIKWIESPSKEESCLLLRSFIMTYR